VIIIGSLLWDTRKPEVVSYTVTANGCSIATSSTITVNALPVPVVTSAGLVLSTGTFTSYQWLRNNLPIAGATAASYTVTQNGDYRVLVTNTQNCKDISVVTTITNVGVPNTFWGRV